MMAPHEPLAEKLAALACDLEGPCYLTRSTSERLLAEHMLPGLQRSDRPVDMQVIGKGEVDGIDLLVAQELLVAAEGPLDGVFICEGNGPSKVTACDRVNPH